MLHTVGIRLFLYAEEDSPLTAESLANIIVADDGYGSSVYIPSVGKVVRTSSKPPSRPALRLQVLISKEDGQQLISAAQSTEARREQRVPAVLSFFPVGVGGGGGPS